MQNKTQFVRAFFERLRGRIFPKVRSGSLPTKKRENVDTKSEKMIDHVVKNFVQIAQQNLY